MIDLATVDLSRLQFALMAMAHFLFVPLTMGLGLLLAVMESVWVITGRPVWRRMTCFWGRLFGAGFALGVATGIAAQFQIGMNWSGFVYQAGEVFGAPLVVEALMAFFLQATLIGLFFFGWDRLSRFGHLAVTWAMAAGASLSALWVVAANAWMQNPVGARLDPLTLRLQLDDVAAILLNPVAQARLVHTASAAGCAGAMIVLSVSAYWLLRGRHRGLARRAIIVAAGFGLACSVAVAVLGDREGYATTDNQQMKLALIDAEWRTAPPPAPFTLFALPDPDARINRHAVEIPFLLGLIATGSAAAPVPGIDALTARMADRIAKGIPAYDALQRLRADPGDTQARADFEDSARHLGHALLLRRTMADPRAATPEQIEQTARAAVPRIGPVFWSFRIMVAIGIWQIALFALVLLAAVRHRLARRRMLLWLSVWSAPLPWIAAQCGWLLAEYGRQPWLIDGVLPTFLGASDLTPAAVAVSLTVFALLLVALIGIAVWLGLRLIRHGPDPDPSPSSPPPRSSPAGWTGV